MFGMRRREFITLLGGAAVWPRAARAQAPGRRPLIAYLAGASSASAFASTAPSLLKGLRDLGYVEGRDFDITYRFADGHMERLPELADEVVRLKPDIILAPTTTPAHVAKQATVTIPIVCPLLENPVGLGLVASHNRPGGNVTGLLRYVDGLAGKTLTLATLLVPGAGRIGMLINVGSAESIDQRRDMNDAAQKLPLKIVPAEVRKPDDLEAAFARLAGERADALVVLQDSLLFSEHRRILALAAAARLPAIWTTRLFAEAGGLIGYGIDEADSFRRAASLIDKILKGAKPGELPVELPTKFELVINLKTAKALGLEIPPTLLALADEVIE
ncbi:MAG TPA: ABC transporter substrate-binding protein [Bradyrhizobium sp.]|nr:ABC transporter substrate-binding protein [Bradyrhizobium sp.]